MSKKAYSKNLQFKLIWMECIIHFDFFKQNMYWINELSSDFIFRSNWVYYNSCKNKLRNEVRKYRL